MSGFFKKNEGKGRMILPVISAIASLLTAIATAILVYVTWMYVQETRKLVQETRKQVEITLNNIREHNRPMLIIEPGLLNQGSGKMNLKNAGGGLALNMHFSPDAVGCEIHGYQLAPGDKVLAEVFFDDRSKSDWKKVAFRVVYEDAEGKIFSTLWDHGKVKLFEE